MAFTRVGYDRASRVFEIFGGDPVNADVATYKTGSRLYRIDTGGEWTVHEGAGGVKFLVAYTSNISPTFTGTVTAQDANILNSLSVRGDLRVASADTSGTPGNATANTPSGRCAIAIGAASVVITCSLIVPASKIFAMLVGGPGAYGTLTEIVSVEPGIPGAGQFTIHGDGVAVGFAGIVDWFVLNPALP